MDNSGNLRVAEFGSQHSQEKDSGALIISRTGNRVTIRLPPKEMAFLRQLSHLRKRSMAKCAREALRDAYRRWGLVH